MNLVQIGQVGKPHGFKGEFLLSSRPAALGLPEPIKCIYLGRDAKGAQPFRVVDTTQMPKGLRIKLEGFESDQTVKNHRGDGVYVQRAELPAAQAGLYYVHDLLGCEVLCDASGESIGEISEVEEVGMGSPDRWWIKTPRDTFAILARRETIAQVDLEQRKIRVRNADDYQIRN